MREETAKGLAQLIEEETAGKISASELLSPRSTSYRQDLKGATIEGENWSKMDLSGADFSGATLDGVDFSRANLNNVRFQEATLLNCNFSSADLVNGNLKNIDAEGCTFREADLRASSWRNSRLSDSTFRNAKHTGVDMRNVKFSNVEWKSDRYRGGLRLDGANLDGFVAISESHWILKQIVLNIADGRKRFEGFAGAVDLGFYGCWLYCLQYLETEFTPAEREEVLGALTSNRKWLNQLRIEYELFRRDWMSGELGGDFCKWSMDDVRQVMSGAKESGRTFNFKGVEGRLNARSIFVPSSVRDEDYDLRDCHADDFLEIILENSHN